MNGLTFQNSEDRKLGALNEVGRARFTWQHGTFKSLLFVLSYF